MKRFLAAVVLLSLPALARAQNEKIVREVETTLFIMRLQDKETGAFKVTADGKPSLRACNGALKAFKASNSEGKSWPANEKLKAFILSCYDPKTGAFAEPGGKPDVAITSVGVMAAVEAGIPKEKFPKAMAYLKENAKTFEEMRIAAAAVEAWGVKDCGFDLAPWLKAAAEVQNRKVSIARDLGSAAAMRLRLGVKFTEQERDEVLLVLSLAQDDDGGWKAKDAKTSDIETTYRVMRCFKLLKEKPKDVKALRAFLEKHRVEGGGATTKPGDPPSMSGVYYVTIIGKWLDQLEGK